VSEIPGDSSLAAEPGLNKCIGDRMRYFMLTGRCGLIVMFLMLAAAHASAAEKLIDILQESKCAGIAGTWVDANTGGREIRTTYAWKFRDRVMEITTRDPTKESVAIMGVNATNGEVFHMGADSNGGSSLGKWEMKDDGEIVLELLYTSGDGQTGGLSIRHRLESNDTMIVTVELPQPISFKMIRKKPKN